MSPGNSSIIELFNGEIIALSLSHFADLGRLGMFGSNGLRILSMYPVIFSVRVPIPKTIGLPDGWICRALAMWYLSVASYYFWEFVKFGDNVKDSGVVMFWYQFFNRCPNSLIGIAD